jgi:phage-related protein
MVGVLVRVLSIPWSIIGAFWGRLIGAFSGVELTFSGIGRAIVNGLKAGITGAWEALLAQIRSLASMLPQVVKDRLGIRSPSRVFAQLGGHVADGFALGIEGGTGGVRSAIGSMVDVGAVGARAASRARGGGAPLALTINVTAPEGADADEWGAVIASAVARELGTRTERVA